MSTTISPAVVAHIAKLAKLPLTEQQIQTFQGQLASVLEYMSHIQQIDTKNVEETSQVTHLTNILREDVVEPNRSFTQEEALANAKQSHNGFFVVDAIFE